MEGPSLYLAAQQLAPFKGKRILEVSGNTTIGKEVFQSKKVQDIFSWGKHLVFQFDGIAFRVHFLLFGTFEAVVEGVAVTGDYKRTREPRLALTFDNGEIKMFNCSIKVFETSDLKSTYDYRCDIMSERWDSKNAFGKIKLLGDEEIGDVLLDQEIFAGVGNIIKNEVLSIVKVNPKTKIDALDGAMLKKIIKETQIFSHQFYEWRKIFELRKHLLIHRKGVCPHCGQKIVREKTGKRDRWSYYCLVCQPVGL